MFSLDSVAKQALLDNGFAPDLDDAARRELEGLKPAPRTPDVRDLRSLLWSSIDNTESRDLDQVEVAEQLPDGAIRVRLGIADVDALVPKDSALDRHAHANATSVYTGVEVYPMLPERLSTDRKSVV